MAKNSAAAVLSFEDPFEEITSIDQRTFFSENPTLNLPELPVDPNSLNYPDHQPGHGLDHIFSSDDPLSDPVIWAFCKGIDDDGSGNFQAGAPSGFPGESSKSGTNGNCNGAENSVQYSCSCCQTLRVIIHSNGVNVKRLEIHGTLGTITHAVLEKYDSSFQAEDFQMFDFHEESMQIVKRFLVQYLEACKQEGYSLLQDPLSTFYEALCVGLNEPVNPDDFLQLSPENTACDLALFFSDYIEYFWHWKEKNLPVDLYISGGCLSSESDMLTQPQHGSNAVGIVKIPLSIQRARTPKLKLKDLIDYFGLPMEDAARKMNVCPTVLKKICRRNGLLRWPYRKIRSIKRKIVEKREVLSLNSGGKEEEKAQLTADIQNLQQQLANIYEAFNK